jgi:hypothetical protein
MLELQEAARSHGVDLAGVLLPKNGRALDRPALAFLKVGEHGHYVTIRPVGHSGRLIQVIDPNNGPRVSDVDRLYSAPEWTGLALVPVRHGWITQVALVLAASFIAVVVWLALHSLRRHRMFGRHELSI